ncbi:NADH:ubiquinone reductase (Na(+)-transporting) subunit B [Tropicimonas isoalkanivorans]|uniref:Na(+)-translocating NADH-quinone reductase subunit B n=1 Tax=Tropicimonas isoalkanivorans TaxID=441112 RepID=A0A1I1DUN3_9RHOB|nr:NADH:ubiquinone reductase (Na(+)-transporting) subunit B [Tropicimonas isoalkanivorans]SFB76420.1 Na+-transporting NADH:ubiquinone oxidoreductase subunit B [Tropicimonas isoalkanivorans]
MGLRSFFDRIEPNFHKGGKYERYFALYEAIESFLYTPKTVATVAPHARAYTDMKRIMTYVVLATLPALLFGLWNTGYQANMALAALGDEAMTGWRVGLMQAIGFGMNPGNFLACMFHGLLWFLPIYIVTMVVGLGWEGLFAVVRGHEINEGFLVTSMLYVLILPASAPLWQVALGISFGVVIGKEVFGGTGKNFLNPALVGRAFLYFAYPAQMSGDSVWTPVDGFSGATALAVSAADGVGALPEYGITFWSAFWGTIQGCIGETSVVACMIGLAFLLVTKVANWRLVVGCLAGTVVFSTLLNLIGSDTNPMFGMPFWWHFVLGGYAFGLAFMVTEPVSAAHTNLGRLWYGALIGFMVVMIRVLNPAFPEGMMLAILFANIFAPLIDWFVVRANISRRAKRNA